MIYDEEKAFGIKYCIWKPNDFKQSEKYPVIFFTHGAGSRGDDLNIIQNHPIINKITSRERNAIIVAPQCSQNSWFDCFGNLIELAETIYNFPYINKNRFYGVGVSMGGYAMFQLMESRPDIFAAGIICCGGGMYWNAERLKYIRLKLFHGEKDTVVYPEESRRMYEKIIDFGGMAEITIYPECDHNCWDKTFNNNENISWLLEQVKVK